jgi:hypothetical protein
MALRILATAILLFSVIFMPFWVSIILGLIGIIYFNYYLEAVAIALLSDLLYGVPEAKFYNIVFISFFGALVLVFLAQFIKKKIRFNN